MGVIFAYNKQGDIVMKEFTGIISRIGAVVDAYDVTKILLTVTHKDESVTADMRLGEETREHEPMAGSTFAEYHLSRLAKQAGCEATLDAVKSNAKALIGKSATVTYKNYFDPKIKEYRPVPSALYFEGETRESSVDVWA